MECKSPLCDTKNEIEWEIIYNDCSVLEAKMCVGIDPAYLAAIAVCKAKAMLNRPSNIKPKFYFKKYIGNGKVRVEGSAKVKFFVIFGNGGIAMAGKAITPRHVTGDGGIIMGGSQASIQTIALRATTHRAPRLGHQIQTSYMNPTSQTTYDNLHYIDHAAITNDSLWQSIFYQYYDPNGPTRKANPNIIFTAYISPLDYVGPLADMSDSTFNATAASLKLSRILMLAFKNEGNPGVILRNTSGNPITFAYNTFFGARNNVINFYITNARIIVSEIVRDYILPGPSPLNYPIYMDGVFYDWMIDSIAEFSVLYDNTIPIDQDNNGIAESNNTINTNHINGYRDLLERTRNFLPADAIITGNAGYGTAENSFESDLNGTMIEQFMNGPIASPLFWSWSQQMNEYARHCINSVKPNFSLLLTASSNAADYTFQRFTMASALMFDGYYIYTSLPPYLTIPWFDEYAVNKTTGVAEKNLNYKGWLGDPLEDAVNVLNASDKLYDNLLPAERGNPGSWGAETKVYWRRYQHGIAVVNPTLSSTSVTLDTTYKKIQGFVDTTFNNGATVTSITLGARQGCILYKP